MAESGRYTLTRAERLRGKRRIDGLWSGTGRSMSVFPIRVVYLLTEAEEGEAPLSMMVTVPKRWFHHAVDRNRIKRQIREAFRHNKHTLTEHIAQGKALHMAFLWQQSLHLSSIEVARRMQLLLQRVSERL